MRDPSVRQEIDHLHSLLDVQVQALRDMQNKSDAELVVQIRSLDELTQSRFVTYRTLIDSQAEKVALALGASDKAISKAEASIAKSFDAVNERFHAVNEFRGQLDDQAKSFMPRAESLQMHAANAARLEAGLNTLGARSEAAANVQSEKLVALGQSMQTAANTINDRINVLHSRLDLIEGRSKGVSAGWGYLVAAVGLASTILFIFIAVGAWT